MKCIDPKSYVCIDPKIQQLKPWYLNCTLNDQDRKVFEKHLEVCPRCAQDFPLDKLIFEAMKLQQ